MDEDENKHKSLESSSFRPFWSCRVSAIKLTSLLPLNELLYRGWYDFIFAIYSYHIKLPSERPEIISTYSSVDSSRRRIKLIAALHFQLYDGFTSIKIVYAMSMNCFSFPFLVKLTSLTDELDLMAVWKDLIIESHLAFSIRRLALHQTSKTWLES